MPTSVRYNITQEPTEQHKVACRPGQGRARGDDRADEQLRVAEGRDDYLVGPTLQLGPIVGGEVVFTPYVCWNLTRLQPNQYQASTALRPVPGGANFGGEHQATENGLYTVPLATV